MLKTHTLCILLDSHNPSLMIRKRIHGATNAYFWYSFLMFSSFWDKQQIISYMDNENYILKIVSLIVFRKKDVGLFHFSYLTNLFLMA